MPVLLALLVAVGVLVAPSPALSPASAVASGTAARGGWTPRPADYPGTVTRTDLPIRMSDGTVLRGDLVLPADA